MNICAIMHLVMLHHSYKFKLIQINFIKSTIYNFCCCSGTGGTGAGWEPPTSPWMTRVGSEEETPGSGARRRGTPSGRMAASSSLLGRIGIYQGRCQQLFLSGTIKKFKSCYSCTRSSNTLCRNTSIHPNLEQNQAFLTTAHLQALAGEGRAFVLKFPYSNLGTLPQVVIITLEFLFVDDLKQVRNPCVYSRPGDRVWLPIGQYQCA